MDKDIDEAKFTIEGNPGQNNTFIHIGKAINVNPNATKVENTFYMGADCELRQTALKEAGLGNNAKKSDGIRLTNKSIRELLELGLIDKGKLQEEIMKYVVAIRPYVKDDKDKLYLRLWARIMDHRAFAIELYDPGSQKSKYNRNLVGNIIHYLDDKGFYKKPYNQSEMTRAVARLNGVDNKGADDPARKGLRENLDSKYSEVIDEILMELEEK